MKLKFENQQFQTDAVNAVAVGHSVYDHIIYDSSTVEKPFALALDDDDDVKMFF